MNKIEVDLDTLPKELTDKLRAALEVKKPVSGPYVEKPKNKEFYYKLYGYGDIETERWEDDSTDNGYFSTGACFPTKEAAEKHLTYLKALQVLRGDTKGYEWEPGETYYTGLFDDNDESLDWEQQNVYVVREGIKFNTVKDIEDSFDSHETEWKIVLGINND